MAREVLLRFGTRRLDEAKKVVREVYRQAKEVAKTLTDAGDRRKAKAEARSEYIANRQAIREAEAVERQENKGRRVRRKSRGGLWAQPGGLPKFGELDDSLFEFAEGNGVFKALDMASRGITSAIPGAAAAMFVIQPLLEEVFRPWVQRQLAAIERKRLDPIEARLREIEANEFARRLREDVNLQERLLGEFSAQDRVLGAALRSKRVVATSQASRISELG